MLLLRGVGDAANERVDAILHALPVVADEVISGTVAVVEIDRIRLQALDHHHLHHAIAGRLLYGPVLDDPNLFELFLIIANVGTALWLFPILKRQHEALSLSYVAARLIENTFIAIGIVSLLGILTLRQEGADAGSLVPVGESLVAMNNWTFLLGPGFVVGIGNGLILGYLMFRSGLVPRGMAMLGLIGGPLATASGIAVLLGVIEQGSAAQGIATIPEILWEASLGLYLTFKGFRPSPILSGDIGAAGVGTA